MIIKSLLDTDLYKLTMGQVALHQFPWVNVKYEFKCRNKADWTQYHLYRIKEEIDNFCCLRFTKDELNYLSGWLFKQGYIDFLHLYQPNLNHCNVWLDNNNELNIVIEGPWFLTIYFEVPVLSIVNEVYFEGADKFKSYEHKAFYAEGTQKLVDKINLANESGFSFADFGTRRRFNGEWQDKVVKILKEKAIGFVGTSNVHLAKKYNLAPIGTMAHEIFMVAQAIYPILDFQKNTLKDWLNEFKGNFSIALTDIIGIDAFLQDFNPHLANAYSGLRHDSGDPYIFADKVISHYEKLGINLKTKNLVFSDGLNFEKASGLYKTYKDKININFGIGTFLTNDFESIIPLQIVIKLTKVNGQDVAKISDSPGKNMCKNLEYVNYLKQVFCVK